MPVGFACGRSRMDHFTTNGNPFCNLISSLGTFTSLDDLHASGRSSAPESEINIPQSPVDRKNLPVRALDDTSLKTNSRLSVPHLRSLSDLTSRAESSVMVKACW